MEIAFLSWELHGELRRLLARSVNSQLPKVASKGTFPGRRGKPQARLQCDCPVRVPSRVLCGKQNSL